MKTNAHTIEREEVFIDREAWRIGQDGSTKALDITNLSQGVAAVREEVTQKHRSDGSARPNLNKCFHVI